MISTYALVFGTDLAYRGREANSMSLAVEGLYRERRNCLRIFITGVTFSMLSAGTFLFMTMRPARPIVPMTLLSLLGVAIVTLIRCRVRPHFKFPEEWQKHGPMLFDDDGFDPEMRMHVRQ